MKFNNSFYQNRSRENKTMMSSYFVIVSNNDTPVYEADFFKTDQAQKVKLS